MSPSTAPAASPMLAAALLYAALGWAVLRLLAGAKIPAERHGLRDATLDPDEIRRRLAGWTGNLGIVLPPGHLALDGDGPHALQGLAARGVSLPATSTQRTPRGRHLIYRLPPGFVARQTVGLAPGVDTRAAGRGYLVAAPSVVAGFAYSWEVPLTAGNIADAPAALLELLGTASATSTSTSRASTGRRRVSPRSPLWADPQTVMAGVAAGERNARIFLAACALRGVGADEVSLARFATTAAENCSPPLPRAEALAIARSAATYPRGDA